MFTLSCVLILPAALQSAGNALSIALGHGPDTYSIPLCTGSVVTHYGAHAWVQQSFIDTIQAASQGTLPAELAEFPAADLQVILSSLILSVRVGGDPLEHWNVVLAANGLAVQHLSEL